MELLVIVALLIIAGSLLYAAWKQMSMSVVTAIACVAIFAMVVLDDPDFLDYGPNSYLFYDLAFTSSDLTDPSYIYTPLTSMYTHASFMHLFINILVLVLMGIVLEQRIGTRHFMVLYLLAGLAGTLLFAALNYGDEFVYVVGASGAISGILGGFGRLYPSDKIMILLLPPMPAWIAVIVFFVLQIILIPVSSGIAYEAHLGGLAAGVVLAPLVLKLPLTRKKVKPRATLSSLRKLATTSELVAMLNKIEQESVPDVRNAWTDHFLAKAKCPHCGSAVRLDGSSIMCEKGHLL
ncbi:MAG: rhomboid family intramembrane serine protease [Thermoplasmata archaeon]|nr:rhomboid family intramembrane serine protease [Thermoplasmata archaeon]